MTPDPSRIVSLVPSWTATVHDLGLATKLVGRTRYCTHPAGLRDWLKQNNVPSVGGTKNARLGQILDLKPDLVITNDEENTPELITNLTAALGPQRVLRTFPRTADEAMKDLVKVGQACGASDVAIALCQHSIARARSRLLQLSISAKPTQASFLYLIWKEPWMAAGDRTYISSLLGAGGLRNCLGTGDAPLERYPIVSPEMLMEKDTVVFFSSEPFAFGTRHIKAFCEEWDFDLSRCLRVDGRALSWYGSLLEQGFDEVCRILQWLPTKTQTEATLQNTPLA